MEQEGFMDEKIWTHLVNRIESETLLKSPELMKPKKSSSEILDESKGSWISILLLL